MSRFILVLGLLVLTACSAPQSGSDQAQRPIRGLYGSFNGGANSL
ncbi:MAG: hypothetical protein WDN49_27390 [Acetobacteraceae bacterium]